MAPLRRFFNAASNIPSHYHDENSLLYPAHSRESSPEADYRAVTSTHRVEDEALPSRERRPCYAWGAFVLRHVPAPVRRAWLATARWVRGPVPPRPWSITPFFPSFQTAPIRFIDKWLPKRRHKVLALGVFYLCWLLVFVTVLRQSSFSGEIEGYGSPNLLACTHSLWRQNNGCGTNGEDCRPFSNRSFAFRCPASCLGVQVLEPYAVGTYMANYQPLVIGGRRNASLESAVYRGDSFICSAAIHAGYITDLKGGCGVVREIGQRSDFPSVSANGIKSIPFDSYFPLSFEFLPGSRSDCADLRWALTGASIAFSILISLFTTSPGVFFWTLFCGLFLHVALVSEPPDASDYYKLFSICIGSFLPAAFCGYAIYAFCVRRTLVNLRAQFEKTLLWVGGLWVGCLNKYTLDHIPLSRLTPHDIKQQPGAVPALVTIILILFLIALGQAWAFRIDGRMPAYLALYGLFVFVLLILAAVPGESLRIHHYILALLLLPGTAIQTRPSLLYQGLLVGLFINGIARWGFAPLLETPGDLLRDAIIMSDLPNIHTPKVDGSRITFAWDKFASEYDGISILVNDVERYRGFLDENADSWAWTRYVEGEPEYFRFGYMNGSEAQDYTRAGTWHIDGSWERMKPGPSRLKI